MLSSPSGCWDMAARQCDAAVASSASERVYSLCIAASGIGGPAWAADTPEARRSPLYLIDANCFIPPAWLTLPYSEETVASKVPPRPVRQATARRTSRLGSGRAPADLATAAAPPSVDALAPGGRARWSPPSSLLTVFPSSA